MTNLPLHLTTWRKPSRCAADEHGDCVDLRLTDDGRVAFRDSKVLVDSPELIVGRADFAVFLEQIKAADTGTTRFLSGELQLDRFGSSYELSTFHRRTVVLYFDQSEIDAFLEDARIGKYDEHAGISPTELTTV